MYSYFGIFDKPSGKILHGTAVAKTVSIAGRNKFLKKTLTKVSRLHMVYEKRLEVKEISEAEAMEIAKKKEA